MNRVRIAPIDFAGSSVLSPGIRWGDLLFVSGQVDAEGVTVDAQTRRVLEKMRAVLRAANTDLDYVVRVGVYLADMGDFAAMNAVYREYFVKDPPARTTVQCRMATDAVRVEIDCIAGIPPNAL